MSFAAFVVVEVVKSFGAPLPVCSVCCRRGGEVVWGAVARARLCALLVLVLWKCGELVLSLCPVAVLSGSYLMGGCRAVLLLLCLYAL